MTSGTISSNKNHTILKTESFLQLRLPILATVTAIFLSIVTGSCSRHKEKSISPSDPLSDRVDSLSRLVYTDPAGVEAAFKALRDSAAGRNPDYWTSMSTIMSITRLMQGDREGSDSVLASVKSFCDAHPGPTRSLGRYYEISGIIHTLYGRNDSAIPYLEKAYDIAMAGRNYPAAINMLGSIAELYELKGDPAVAVQHFRRALFLADSTGMHENDFSTRTRTAGAYTSMGNYPEADHFFEMNLPQLYNVDEMTRFFFYSNRGNSYYYRQDYGSALRCFLRAGATLDSMAAPDPNYIAVTDANIGECYMFLDSLNQAADYIDTAVGLFNALAVNDINQTFYLNSLRGSLALKQGDINRARELLLAIDPSEIAIAPRYIASHYNRLRDFYAAIGDYRRSLDYTLKATEINDSLRRRINANFAEEVNTRYRQDTTILNTRLRVIEKDEEVKSLYLWIYGVILIALIISGAIVWMSVRRNRRNREEVSMLHESLISTKMENVRNRLSPHFIFNVLNSEIKDRNDGVANLFRLMRHNLELCNRQVIPLSEELSFIDNYLAVERGALGDSFVYSKSIDPAIDPDKVKIPAMILQIFVENAVKHGLKGHDDPHKRLNLDAELRDGNIVYTVTNSSAPDGSAPHAPGTGTGLRVVSQTIQTLNSRSKRKIDLCQKVVEDSEIPGRSLYRIILTIPADFNFSILERGTR